MEVIVRKNDKEVFSSGHIFVVKDETIEFALETLKFKLCFKTDESENKHVETQIKEKTCMELTCWNFNDPSNVICIPQKMADVDGREIFLDMYVTTISSDVKVLFYCWYYKLRLCEQMN